MAKSNRNWFDVDHRGLGQILERRGKAFALFELIQNAWDEDGVTRVDVELEPVEGKRGLAALLVEDDVPGGFADLTESYTLFAPSRKKVNPEKRGRFNAGEKLVIALCQWVQILTETGGVRFDHQGRHRINRCCRERGSAFEAEIRMTREEVVEASRAVQTLLVPPGIVTTFNGEALPPRTPVHRFEAKLPTEYADVDGVLRPTTRTTTIELCEPREGEVASIYELGIPVQETGDRWHVNVLQKVPLTLDRAGVPPRFLAQVRTLVMNEMHAQLTPADAVTDWVQAATSDPKCSPSAITRALDLRFGPKRVSYDPSDPEANKLAQIAGYTVVPGGALSAQAWATARDAGAILPAGRVTPSPAVVFDPDGPPLDVVDEATMAPGMRAIVEFTRMIGARLLGQPIRVDVARFPISYTHGASYGNRRLTFNQTRLGKAWFAGGVTSRVVALVLHELAHHYTGDHHSMEYHDAICRLGARLTRIALDDPAALAAWKQPSKETP